MRRRAALLAAAIVVSLPAGAAAQDGSRDEPVVIPGGSVESMNGVAPGSIVGFRFRRTRNGRHEKWTQIPVQVDQRKLADFGSAPTTNAAPGIEGTVYGTEPIGQRVLQYADPATFVGADPDPNLDPDDEIALMAGDAGDRVRKRTKKPKGVYGHGAVRATISDPLGAPTRFVYLYRSKGDLDPAAGSDYVRYAFRLAAGDYRSGYGRAVGPNPETSTISTDAYEIGFSDRWYYDQLAIKAQGATAADILDGYKFSFGPTSCGRSEATFNAGEGAFVANVDGPVRAIRSYVGANSGPLTERTHYFYGDRHLIVTDLRVHPVPGPLTYHDLSAAGLGMTYLDSVNPGGVAVDGIPDAIADGVPAWHLWTGPQGSLFSADRVESSFAAELLASGHDWYLDDATPAPNVQCWGDAEAYGQGGLRSTFSMPNTDPRSAPAATLHTTTTDVLAGPGMTAASADALARALDTPLQTAIKSQ